MHLNILPHVASRWRGPLAWSRCLYCGLPMERVAGSAACPARVRQLQDAAHDKPPTDCTADIRATYTPIDKR